MSPYSPTNMNPLFAFREIPGARQTARAGERIILYQWGLQAYRNNFLILLSLLPFGQSLQVGFRKWSGRYQNMGYYTIHPYILPSITIICPFFVCLNIYLYFCIHITIKTSRGGEL